MIGNYGHESLTRTKHLWCIFGGGKWQQKSVFIESGIHFEESILFSWKKMASKMFFYEFHGERNTWGIASNIIGFLVKSLERYKLRLKFSSQNSPWRVQDTRWVLAEHNWSDWFKIYLFIYWILCTKNKTWIDKKRDMVFKLLIIVTAAGSLVQTTDNWYPLLWVSTSRVYLLYNTSAAAVNPNILFLTTWQKREWHISRKIGNKRAHFLFTGSLTKKNYT